LGSFCDSALATSFHGFLRKRDPLCYEDSRFHTTVRTVESIPRRRIIKEARTSIFSITASVKRRQLSPARA
jgi:hypothetical protein